MMRSRAGIIFTLVFAWQVGLFIFSAQPVPANDAFFYDGAVVNYLLNGNYCNPSLAMALPISGTKIFSAYPPLYNGLLLVWMSVFGTSARAAMLLHLVLFGLYLVALLAIFKRLRTPDWCAAVAGGFLFLLTFRDRPDSLAHLFGMLAVYAWIRSRRIFSGAAAGSQGWTWGMVLFGILTLGTSLQIGGIYLVLIWIGTVLACRAGQERFPIIPMAATILIPAALLLMVKTCWPEIWAGFQEHARQTPSLTGWRAPQLDEMLKVARTVPGVILAAVLLPGYLLKRGRDTASSMARHETVMVATLVTALCVVAACLCVLTANTVAIANYLQPLIVAGYLTLAGSIWARQARLRLQVAGFLLLMLMGSLRLIGMSTWGILCARDMSYSVSIQQISHDLDQQPAGARVVLSSAYLYEAARHNNISAIHSDWLQPLRRGEPASDLEGLAALKPPELILTQFDYYRRYQSVVEQLKSDPRVRRVAVENSAKIRPPDAYKSIQKIVQHISWAPVVVQLDWR